MAAVTSTIIGAVASAAPTVGALVGAYSAVKGTEAAEKSQKQQAEALEASQDAQNKEIKAQKAAALKKRKGLIDRTRKQIVGEGDYSVGQTGATGVQPIAGASGSEVLG